MRMCGCNGRMISYMCKNRRGKGRMVRRCMFWKNEETRNLFIWDDDIAQENYDYECVHEEWSKDESKVREMQDVETLKELYESSMKNNKRLQIKIKSESFWGKLKSICIVFSFLVNMYLLMKCKY